jgi:hypothetical protein
MLKLQKRLKESIILINDPKKITVNISEIIYIEMIQLYKTGEMNRNNKF